MASIKQTEFMVNVTDTDRLAIRRFGQNPDGQVVLMIHGAIENGRIFYSNSGKGLAPFLAEEGFDVFVADLRGHGDSQPVVGPHSNFGQYEMICEDMPAIRNAIAEVRGDAPVHVVAHSWGGVIVSSFLARFPEYIPGIRSLTYFGTKRNIRILNIHRILKIDLAWRVLGTILCRLNGYLPAEKWHLGSDNESAGYYLESMPWIKPGSWVDPRDGFDYEDAARQVTLPPAWFIAAAGDHCLGHPKDVLRFMGEHAGQQLRYSVLAARNGNRKDYDHITMLTDADARQDHFPEIVSWLRSSEKNATPTGDNERD